MNVMCYVKYLLHLCRIFLGVHFNSLTLTWSKRKQFVTRVRVICVQKLQAGCCETNRLDNDSYRKSQLRQMMLTAKNIVFIKMTNTTISILKIQAWTVFPGWAKIDSVQVKVEFNHFIGIVPISHFCMQICAFVSIWILRRFSWLWAMENHWFFFVVWEEKSLNLALDLGFPNE